MRLVTFEAPGHSGALSGFLQDDRVVAFGGPDGVKEALAAGRVPGPSGGTWPLDDVRLVAPVHEPGTIYAIGLNYAKHVEEMAAPRLPTSRSCSSRSAGRWRRPEGRSRCSWRSCARLDYEVSW